MSYFTAEGSKFYFSRTFGAAKTVSAITNADPAVATSTAHGLSDGAELLVTSGWEDLNELVLRLDSPTTNNFNFEDFDSSDTTFYPAGSGAGTVKQISSWLEFPQVLTVATSGGEPRYVPVEPLAARNSTQIAVGFNAMSLTLTLGWDPTNANYRQAVAATRRLEKVAIKVVEGNGAVSYGYGSIAAAEMPARTKGQVNQVSVAISMPRIFSYAS